MLNKDFELMIDRFIGKCKEINSAISSESCRRVAEGIILNAGGNKHLVVRVLNHEVVKLKRQQHTSIKPTKVKDMGIDEFISKNINPETISEIRGAFKGV